MSEYLDYLTIEAKFDNVTWTDVTADVLLDAISGTYGIAGSGPLDRIASTGTLTFTLINNRFRTGVEGYYTPGSPYCRSGFKKGCKIRLRLYYRERVITKFYGRITTITPDPDAKTTKVVVSDWFDLAASQSLSLVSYTSNKRIDEIVPLIVANMPIQPLKMELNRGQDTFPDVFDTVRDTKAMTELAKLASSELGYIFLRFGSGDETLVVQGRYTRSSISAIKSLDKPIDQSGLILCEDGSTLLQDGTPTPPSSGPGWQNSNWQSMHLVQNGDRFDVRLNQVVYGTVYNAGKLLTQALDNLVLEDGSDVVLDEITISQVVNPVQTFGLTHGEEVYNQIRYTAYPRTVDSVPSTVLFSLNSPIALAAGEEKTNILGQYRDPTGGATRISGRDLQTPTATTDYRFNSAQDGTGTDLTANLQVTASYGAEGVKYTLKNNGATSGYVIKLQARGRGVYIYDPLTLVAEDVSSQAENGILPLTLDLKYQKSIDNVSTFASVILAQYKTPVTKMPSLAFLANDSYQLLTMFLDIEPGQRIAFSDQVSGVDQDFFVNGVSFEIRDRLIYCTWYVKGAGYEPSSAYWVLGVPGKTELGITTVLGY